MDEQSIQAKKGEITFRRMLSRQETGDEICEPEVFSAEEIIPVLAQSIEETRQVITDLQARGIGLVPFLELGAERGHRGYCLVNEFDAPGVVFDLSFDALSFGERLQTAFDYDTPPLRICGDAYNLPFRSDSFPFVFCFATLHHFPDPVPIVAEAVRVLQDGGYFYFSREPTRGTLTVTLWTRRGHKLSRVEQWLSKLGILGFISEGGGVEREYGILENTFRLETWTGMHTFFESLEMQVNKTLKLRFDPTRDSFKRRWAKRLGGVTTGLGRAHKPNPPVVASGLMEMLRCPTCRQDTSELKWHVPEQSLICAACGTIYPQHHGIFILMDAEQRQKLYPDL